MRRLVLARHGFDAPLAGRWRQSASHRAMWSTDLL